MTKLQFLMSLHDALSALPKADAQQRLEFYSEMIEDRMEEGLSEEEAVAAMGPVDQIAAQIIAETPLIKLAREKVRPKRALKAWEIVLLALGSPLWLPLLLAAGAVILSVYVSAWSVIGALWSAFGSVVACAFAGVVTGIAQACAGHVPTAMAILAAGLVCAGLSILIFHGCHAVTKGIVILTKKFAVWLKNCCTKKEATV